MHQMSLTSTCTQSLASTAGGRERAPSTLCGSHYDKHTPRRSSRSLRSSAALHGEMTFCGRGFEAYNARHVAPSTPSGVRPLVLCCLPRVAPAADSLGIAIRLFGAGDSGAARGARLPAQCLGVPAGPLARDHLSALSARDLHGDGIHQRGRDKAD